MRKGLLCRRRLASSSNTSLCCSRWAISAARWAWRSAGWPRLFEPQDLPQVVGQQDQFGIDLGTTKTQHFGTNLVELAVAATLRTLVAEHGAHVIQALATFVQQVVLDHSAHQTCCALGAQGQLFTIESVFKGVHLFFDNVGHLAQAPNEKCCGLNNGQSHVAVGIARHQATHLRLQPLPAGRIGRQDVVHALDADQFLGLGGFFGLQRGVFFQRLAHFFSAAPEPNRFSM
jgi:hypothetical protein